MTPTSPSALETATLPEGTIESSTELQDTPSTASDGYLVHDILKGLEVSFGIEASLVERDALDQARAWADKGLPRHDLQGKLEVEEFLARRAAHVLAGWSRRARARIEGAIQAQSERIGRFLIAFEQQLLHYRYLLDELRACRTGLLRALSEDQRQEAEIVKLPKRRVALASQIGSISFWVLCAILVVADFVANLPVFSELLPLSPIARETLPDIERNLAANPMTFGLSTFFNRLFMQLDASIFAFSVILFVVILGHFLGRSIRTIAVLHRNESYVDQELLARHKHQPKVVAWGSAFGIVVIVGFLFAARALIEPAAQVRLTQGQAELQEVTNELISARTQGNPSRVQQLELRRQTLEGTGSVPGTVQALQERHEYARMIGKLNGPILALNVVLALCAALLGYLHHSESLEIEPGRSPQALSARERYLASKAAVEREQGAIRDVVADIETGIRRIRHLADSRPLLNAEAKAERLRAVIPLFRSENARVRGLDSRSILAFEPEPTFVSDSDLETPFRVPDFFAESLQRYERLQSEFSALERDREVATELAE